MKKVFILMAAVLLQTAVYAQTWKLDKAHSNLKFTVTHLMLSDVDGSFKDFDATITSAKPDFSDAKITFTAQVASVNTENEKRDGHLKTADFFDAAKFPTIAFTSTGISKISASKYKVTGNLTMHGVTKPAAFELWHRGTKQHPMLKTDVAGVQVTGTINRKDFGVGSAPEAVVSEEVTFKANGEFAKQ
ncbi:MAG: polyisoprenoid-binding protein [Sphingobacteriaceae bacterium]|nr:MAG: polyisoprenoid-binding protein [Sphingobacteriaceae bacterium]